MEIFNTPRQRERGKLVAAGEQQMEEGKGIVVAKDKLVEAPAMMEVPYWEGEEGLITDVYEEETEGWGGVEEEAYEEVEEEAPKDEAEIQVERISAVFDGLICVFVIFRLVLFKC
ncbi:hypothetical protein RND71_030914 [Anisodus tanguticus]|uniref:Uncharacterized protein n=1 Tax=Anisodus tanguticus TaxID=243964 RepID=A0AAE1RGZ6_9SOLA|nr:hypothetical protein RND71_030914 [Anisodus tanguticus]